LGLDIIGIVVDSRQIQEFHLFSIASIPAVGSTQLPIQLIRLLSLGVKWLAYETDHPSLSRVQVRNERNLTPLPPVPS
jgi:hypothetical protein